MEYVDFFDYGNVNEDHGNAVREVIKWLETVEKQPVLAKKLLHRFNLEPRKKIDVEDSIFYKYITEFGLFFSVQGYLQTETGYDIPHCSICATSQDLDAFFHWAVKKRLEEMTEEEKEKLSGMLPPGVPDSSPTPNLPNDVLEMYQVDESARAMLDDISNLNK